MKTILFANRKGGVGKSFCSCETVMSLKRSDIPTSFYDMDGQEGNILQTEEVENAKVTVLDAPGALTSNLAELIHDADVVCVPVLPSIVDAPSFNLMVKAFTANKKKGARLVVILNRFTRWTNSKDYLTFLQEELQNIKGAEVVTMVQSEIIMQAALAGKSVAEFAPRSTAAASVLNMVNVIRSAAGLPIE